MNIDAIKQRFDELYIHEYMEGTSVPGEEIYESEKEALRKSSDYKRMWQMSLAMVLEVGKMEEGA
jgi:hypothetical protein